MSRELDQEVWKTVFNAKTGEAPNFSTDLNETFRVVEQIKKLQPLQLSITQNQSNAEKLGNQPMSWQIYYTAYEGMGSWHVYGESAHQSLSYAICQASLQAMLAIKDLYKLYDTEIPSVDSQPAVLLRIY